MMVKSTVCKHSVFMPMVRMRQQLTATIVHANIKLSLSTGIAPLSMRWRSVVTSMILLLYSLNRRLGGPIHTLGISEMEESL